MIGQTWRVFLLSVTTLNIRILELYLKTFHYLTMREYILISLLLVLFSLSSVSQHLDVGVVPQYPKVGIAYYPFSEYVGVKYAPINRLALEIRFNYDRFKNSDITDLSINSILRFYYRFLLRPRSYMYIGGGLRTEYRYLQMPGFFSEDTNFGLEFPLGAEIYPFELIPNFSLTFEAYLDITDERFTNFLIFGVGYYF